MKTTETKVYGASDDLIEFEGEFTGEVGSYADGGSEQGDLVAMSDGTFLEVQYEKNGEAIWGIKLLKKGSLFDRIDQCDDEDAKPHSDIAYFKSGIKWAYVARKWEKVQ